MTTSVAAIQLESGASVDVNLDAARGLLEEAADRGARLAVLPENFAFMGEHERDKLDVAETHGGGPIQAFLSEQAERLGLIVVGGTVPIRAGDGSRARAACCVYDATGREIARYDKLFLFDVQIPGTDEGYEESAVTEPGTDVVVVETAVGRVGLAVCYDLRFPELFRRHADAGAGLIALPAAFTRNTGRAHWESLIRARAIENQSLVIAAAQGGSHPGGRETFGDSMIVDAWGTVLARCATGAGVIVAEFDPDAQNALRSRFPALAHRRELPPAGAG